MKRKTLNEFIKESNHIHHDEYDYSLVEYSNNRTKVKIICPKHGIFEQSPDSHLSGKKCRSCKYEKMANKFRKKIYKFIEESTYLHKGFYNYKLVEYINNHKKIKIICPNHGEFEQTPRSHLNGNGCPICSKNKKGDTQSFIKKSMDTHGDRYDYSLVEYINNKTKVKIICKEHGVFEQNAKHHYSGSNCPRCVGGSLKSKEDFI